MENFTMILGYAMAIISPTVTWILSRRQSAKEIDKLQAEINGMQKQNTGVDLANIKTATEILTENVVRPLEKELQSVRRELFRFRKAIEKANNCKYESDCPVKKELREQNEINKHNNDKDLD